MKQVIAPERAARLMRLATSASVATAAVLIGIKLVAWMLTDSVSLFASLIDSAMDVLASLVNYFAVRHALQPADREHRFGHGKAEPLAALGQAAFITGSGIFLLMEASHRIIQPRPVEHGAVGIGVMVFATVATLALVAVQRYTIRKTDSTAVRADAMHYVTDVLVNGAVILSLVLSTEFGWKYADPLFAIAIAGYIVYAAWRIAREALDQLMDRELPDDDRERIKAIALAHPEVSSLHDLRTRASGLSTFIQLHLEMDGNLSLVRAHEIADAVEAEIMRAFPNAEVIIHEDPAGVEEERPRFAGS